MERWSRATLAILLLSVCFSACKKKAPPPKPPMQTAPVVEKPTPAAPKAEDKAVFPEGFETLAPEAKEVWLKAEVKPRIPKNLDRHPAAKQAHWLHMLVALEKRQRLMAPDDALAKIQTEKVRREYIRPTPRGFKPLNVKRKLKLTLTPERDIIHRGERFSYRLEMQNVGREPIGFAESPSPFLTGQSLRPYLFILTPPNGKKELMYNTYGSEVGGSDIYVPGGEHMTDAESNAALRKMEREERHRGQLRVDLQPGETLVSKSRGGAFGSFRELHTIVEFDAPGTYRIKLVYSNPPPDPPDEAEIQRRIKRSIDRESQMKAYRENVEKALGRVESNEVSIEVAMTILLLVLLSLPNQAQASTPCPKELEDRVFLCTPSKAEQDEILDHARKGTKAQAKIEGAAKEEVIANSGAGTGKKTAATGNLPAEAAAPARPQYRDHRLSRELERRIIMTKN